MKTPNMNPVQSSNVISIGYDDGENALFVSFKGGSLYVYRGVPPKGFEELLASESKGKYLNQNIKPHYTAVKIS